jgi:hypothetical protein
MSDLSYSLGEDAQQRFDTMVSWRPSRPKEYIQQRSKLFELVKAAYKITSELDHALWATKARYAWALACESLSRDLLRAGISPSQSEQLQKQAKKLHADNLITRTGTSDLEEVELWVAKSRLAIAGLEGEDKPETPFHIPHAIHLLTPTDWHTAKIKGSSEVNL